MPAAIVSDRDHIFTSQFWKDLFSLAGVELRISSSYHPQSDGQTERLNQTMETFLRCYVNACPTKWSQWIPLAEYWYNTSNPSAIGRSPFEALYGYQPRHFGIGPHCAVSSSELSSWLQERRVMHDLIRQHLARSRLRMKRQADKNRSERSFVVGDKVFLKLQPYVQSSLAPRANQKLAFKYFGPFEIVDKVGQVAYKLKLPPYSSLHPVFHGSQLKLAVLPSDQVMPTLPNDVSLPRVHARILQCRVAVKGSQSVRRVLVQWSG